MHSDDAFQESETADSHVMVVASVLAAAGIGSRRLRDVVVGLAGGPVHLDDLIRQHAVPRKSVEAILRAAGTDLVTGPAGLSLPASYAQRFAHTPGSADVDLTRLVADVPTDKALDHVSATAETAGRRAGWLDETYTLDGAHLLCVGDHDLTSLAVCAVRPGVRVTVVDVDDRLLAYIAAAAAERGYAVDCLWGDLRYGLPPSIVGSADLVFTDPPYTPEGVQLFLGRGAQGLRDRQNGRLVMAYGYSPLTPALGLKVQRAVLDLDLALEAMLPAFNRYHGAQAVGSASDLYVCRPTSRTWQILDKRLASAAVNIYTHGSQSLEGTPSGPGPGTFLAGPVSRVPEQIDLSGDPGSWLLRVLLAVNAPSVRLLVPNNHPDIADARGQHALQALVAGKWKLRYLRSNPSPREAIVESTAVPSPGFVLTHAHGKLGNALRESYVQSASLTKNEARERVAALGLPESALDARLLDLPRHLLETVLL